MNSSSARGYQRGAVRKPTDDVAIKPHVRGRLPKRSVSRSLHSPNQSKPSLGRARQSRRNVIRSSARDRAPDPRYGGRSLQMTRRELGEWKRYLRRQRSQNDSIEEEAMSIWRLPIGGHFCVYLSVGAISIDGHVLSRNPSHVRKPA